MDDPNKNNPADAPNERFVVFRTDKGVSAKIGIVSWRTKGDSCRLQATAEGLDQLETLRRVLNELSQGHDRPSSFEEFREAFARHGLTIEELPHSDMQVTFEYDQQTGNLVGRTTPLHAHAASDEGLSQDILKAIRQGMRQPMAELAAKLDASSNGDAAAQILRQAGEEGKLGFAPTRGLLDALLKIDVMAASPANRKYLRTARFEVAQRLNDYDVGAVEAEALLTESSADFPPQERADVETAMAIGLARKGRTEAALAVWRRLLGRSDPLTAASRGWIWRNIAKTLGTSSKDTLDAAKQSADAFLEAGDKSEAGKSLMMVVDILLKEDPKEAVARLDEIVALTEREGMRNQQFRAASFHARARRLFDLRQYRAAFEDAEKAVASWKGLLGSEANLVSSMHLAALILRADGRESEANKFSNEADQLTRRLRLAHFELANRVMELLKNYNAELAEEIEQVARSNGNMDVCAGVVVARAMNDPSLRIDQRLALLEELLTDLDDRDAPASTRRPARQAVATLLSKAGQLARALTWWEQLADETPFDDGTFGNLLYTYEQLGRWGDAERFLRAQIAVRGEGPSIQYVLGRVLHSAGKMGDAVMALQKAVELAPEGSDVKRLALELREKALAAGGVPTQPVKLPAERKVSRDEFEAALDEFSKHASSDQRMQFWKRSKEGRHIWISNPERFAQNQLHSFLKGKFGTYSAVFEEIGAGAGRLDLFVQLSGGLQIVIELKMCGSRYSTTYAANGEGQILHYLEHRNTSLGYLVVFDARINANGSSLLPARRTGNHTVREILIDVRPSVPSKAAKTSTKDRKRRTKK